MCDFHSICVRRDGAIAHIPENSHSLAIKRAGWCENGKTADFRKPHFSEVEWSGVGDFSPEKIARGLLSDKQIDTIKTHYGALAKLLADPGTYAEIMCFGGGRFAGAEYADVRWHVLISENCPKRVAAKLGATKLHSNGEEIKSLHPKIKELSGSVVIASGANISSQLTSIGGSLYVRKNAKFDAPVLTSIGGSLYVRKNAKFDAPALKFVNGKPYKV